MVVYARIENENENLSDDDRKLFYEILWYYFFLNSRNKFIDYINVA